MANRRMIAKSISVSDQTNSIGEFAALLFTWMIPHADDYGIIAGTPSRIRALVVPRLSRTDDEVDAALDEMAGVGLIVRYEHGGLEYVQLAKFEEHQEGLHKRCKCKHPLPSSEGVSILSRKFPEIPGNSRLTEPNLNERNLTEPNPREGNRSSIELNHVPDPVENIRTEKNDQGMENAETDLTDVVNALSRVICPVDTPVERAVVRSWLDAYSRAWVLAAVEKAAQHKAGSLKYVGTILQAWQRKYKPSDEPWTLDSLRGAKQRASPGKSFAMAKLEQMAREALAEEEEAAKAAKAANEAAGGQVS